jgi:PhnB protein
MAASTTNPVLQPYLFFDGRCEEALEFYRSALGAEVLFMMRFKDSPEPPQPGGCATPGSENKIMHASVRIGDSTIMASDGRNTGHPNFQGFSLSLKVSNVAQAERLFTAVGNGGQVVMPLTKTFFSPSFGMVNDRFGICWMVLVAQEPNA